MDFFRRAFLENISIPFNCSVKYMLFDVAMVMARTCTVVVTSPAGQTTGNVED